MAQASSRPTEPMSGAGSASESFVDPALLGSADRRSIFEAGIDRIWRFFCSVRVAIWEIAFLALLTLIGTLRGSDVPQLMADQVPALQSFVDGWYAWDVFGSILFAGTLAVLAVATLIGGMINRAPGIWKSVAQPTVLTTHGFIQSATPGASFTTTALAGEFSDQLRAELQTKRFRVLTEQRNDEIHVYADRNRWSKLATFPFHISLIMIMVGGIVAGQFGFRDMEFIVPEGETVAVGHGTDVSVRLDQFTDSYFLDGTAQEYRSDITMFAGDQATTSGTVFVNDPLTYQNVTVYQTSFGTTVDLRVTDRFGVVVHDGAVPLGIFRSRTNPDAPAGQLHLADQGITLNLIAPDQEPWNEPELDTLRLGTEQLYIQARTDTLAPGVSPAVAIMDTTNPANLGDFTVDFQGYGRYSLFQVASNPGIPIFFAASVLMIGGLIVTFYLPHRRIRAIITQQANGSALAQFAPLAKRDWSAKRDFLRTMEHLGERMDVPPMIVIDDDSPSNARTFTTSSTNA